jgi:hypothetical protein
MSPVEQPDQPNLPLAAYRFRYRASDELHLTEDPRGLWHGVLGLHLRRLACIVPGTDCDRCLLLHQCDYSLLFSGPRPPEAELMRRYDRIPVPHVLHIPVDAPVQVAAGGELSVEMVLVGRANERLPLVVAAMAAAGDAGLGASRGRLALIGLEQQHGGAAAPGDAPGPAAEQGIWQPLLVDGRLAPAAPPAMPVAPASPTTVRLRFTSPYKPSGKAAGAAAEGIGVGPLLMAIVRRVSMLQYFYSGRRLDAPFADLKAMAEATRVLDHQLHPRRSSRWAARRGTRVDTSGLIGHLDLALDANEPLWPYLYLGQWLNVGKNASMGFGSYRLETL